jgi:hypothetical protein
MTDWPDGWRPNNLEEAQEYLATHVGDDGDPATREACQIEIEMHTPGGRAPTGSGATKQSPYPQPSPDLIEEEGAD